MILPPSVKLFVWYIVNEAHEDSGPEQHKYVSNHNPIYLPSDIVIPQGTAISFLDADAPWDTPILTPSISWIVLEMWFIRRKIRLYQYLYAESIAR